MASRTAPSSHIAPEIAGDWQAASGFAPSYAPPSIDDRNLAGNVPNGRRFTAGSQNMTFESLEGIDFPCLSVICGCSFIILIQAAVECSKDDGNGCQNEYGWSVAAGLISFLLSFVSLVWKYLSEETFKRVLPLISIFFVAWWIFGTGISTFKAPFNETGNGYFAAWTCFITAFLLAGSSIRRIRSLFGVAYKVIAGSIEAKLEMGILAASVVLIFAVAVEASQREEFDNSYETTTGSEVWGLVCGLGSTILIIAHKLLRSCCEQITFRPYIIGGALSVWWLFGVGALTFDQPFESGGNGYFSCWTCLILAIWLTWEGYDGYDEITTNGQPIREAVPMGIPEEAHKRVSYESGISRNQVVYH